MQTAENSKISLRAIDGRLADLAISAVHGQTPGSARLVEAISDLVSAAGANVITRQSPPEGPEAVAPISLEAPLLVNADLDGVTITRLRSFYPIVRTQLAGLDMALVSHATPGIDDTLLDAACHYARRFNRRRIDVVVPAQGIGQSPDDIERRLDDWRDCFPDIEFRTAGIAKLIGGFAAGRADADIVVAPAVFADILKEVAGVLSGAAGLATVTRFDAGVISIHADGVDDVVQPAAALILGVADLLAWLGRADASGRIVNGWGRTLEYGCHTEEFSVLSPYSRRLDAAEFAAVVASRLDDTPRTLELRQPGSGGAKTRKAGSHLRLVV